MDSPAFITTVIVDAKYQTLRHAENAPTAANTSTIASRDMSTKTRVKGTLNTGILLLLTAKNRRKMTNLTGSIRDLDLPGELKPVPLGPNAKVSGGGTPSAALPGYAGDNNNNGET